MTQTLTNLSFSTVATQSLWGPGASTSLSVDTGDLMVWDPGKSSTTLALDAKPLFAFSADAYLDVRFGLVAYASLGNTGGFDAAFDLALTVDHPSAVVTGPGSKMVFDFSRYTIGASSIASQGFDIGGATAGLKLVIDASAGIENISYWLPFVGDTFADDVSFFDVSTEITLIEVSQAFPELEYDLGSGISLIARLPTGADTEGSTFGETTVSGSGHSDTRFLAIKADLDALAVDLLKKIPFPVTQGIAKVLENIVFAEFKFDVHDYIPFIPADTLTLEAKVLDIEAEAGAVVTEKTSLDIGNGDDVPEVAIVLRSDSGTPDDFSDDQVGSGVLGGTITLDSPTQAGTGTARVTAYYDLQQATFGHSVGVGLNAAITISALQAEIGGSIGELLGISFGPLLEVEIPEGGLNLDLFDFYHDQFAVGGGHFDDAHSGSNPNGWTYSPGAFGQNTAVYEVFFSDQAPAGWDQNQPGALQALQTFAEAAQVNLAALRNTLGEVAAGKTTVSLTNAAPNFTSTGLANRFIVWQGNTNSTVDFGNDLGNVLGIQVLAPTSGITVRTTPTAGLPSDTAEGVARQLGVLSKAEIKVNGVTLTTADSVNIVGTQFNDFLPYIGDEAQFFDGGAGQDTFIADFGASHPTDAIQLDVGEYLNGAHALSLQLHEVRGGTTFTHTVDIKNVENFALITGDQDDYLTTGFDGADFFDTRGGNDLIHVRGDFFSETFMLGSGDDVAALDFVAAGPLVKIDAIFGETGVDEAIVTGGAVAGIRWNLLNGLGRYVKDTRLESGQTYFVGLGAESSAARLEDFDAKVIDLLDPGLGLAARALRDANDGGLVTSPEALQVTYGTESNGGFRTSVDVEALSIVGDAATDDLAIFTGGAVYRGGAGGADTFVADFSAFEGSTLLVNEAGERKSVADLGRGVALSADPARLATDGVVFGTSFVGGFERLVVTGTSFADRLVGGALDDQLRGGAGNDVLEGGGGSNVLFGGEGNDRFITGPDELTVVHGESSAADSDWLTFVTGGDHGSAANDGGIFWAFFDAGGANVAQVDAFADFNGLNVATALIQDGNSHALSAKADASKAVFFQAVEHVNVAGSDAFDDLLVYGAGASYEGGERAGDADTFAADFRGQDIGLTFLIDDDVATSYTLENGVHVSGIDRAFIKFSDDNDVARGGRLDDRFEGNGGNDSFTGGGGDDFLDGGAGDDLFYFTGLAGNDEVVGGTGTDRLLISAQASDGTVLTDGGIASFFRKVEADGSVTDLIPGFLGAGTDSAAIADAVALLPQAGVLITFVGSGRVEAQQIEMVEIQGSDAFDDLELYQGGLYYAGGERAGDHDVFVANFTGETRRLTLQTADASDPADPTSAFNDIGNGAQVGEFESLFVTLGAGNDKATGGAFDDFLDGGDGNDLLDAGTGHDRVLGGAGNDVVLYKGGQAELSGGTGIDTLEIAAQAATTALVVGGDRSVTINPLASATTLRSVLTRLFATPTGAATTYTVSFAGGNGIAYDGFEKVDASGGDGSDALIAGDLGGVLSGGAGNDLLIGLAGNDILLGGDGADRYAFGGAFGQDVIGGEIGGANTIDFVGRTRAQILFSAAGDDLVLSQGANRVTVIDYFAGGANGLDFTFGFSDFTGKLDLSGLGALPSGAKVAGVSLKGTAASDLIENAGAGGTTANADQVDSGAGNDFIVGSRGADVLNGSLGQDTVVYRDSTSRVVVDLASGLGRFGDAENDLLVGIENLMGSVFGDILTGDEASNSLAGGRGNDRLEGRGGDDFLAGGEDDDTLKGEAGEDKLFGDDGNDLLSGGADNDYLDGGRGNDVSSGEGGDDLLIGGEGDDQLLGGAGNDTGLYTDPGDGTPGGGAPVGGRDLFDGGAGIDTLDLSRLRWAATIDLGQLAVTTDFDGTAPSGPAEILLDLVSVEWATATPFDDQLLGSSGDDRLAGDLGDDRFVGGAGADGLLGGIGSDLVDYGAEGGGQGIHVQLFADTDGAITPLTVISGTATDSFGAGDTLDNIERVIGTAQADVFEGDGIFTGGDGADSFFGAFLIDYGQESGGLALDVKLSRLQNKDTFGNLDQTIGVRGVIGAAGNDVLVGNGQQNFFTGGAGSDRIDGVSGLSGGDVLDYSRETGASGVLVRLTGAGSTGTARDTFGTLDRLHAIQNVFGTAFADTLIGGNQENLFLGGAGNDDLDGGGLSDVLHGGDGNDRLDGGSGSISSNDRLYGEAGDDTLVARLIDPGSRAADGDLLDGGDGFDTVVVLSGVTDFTANLATGEINDAPRMTGIEGIVAASGDDRLIGSAADNRLDGGAGSDLLKGGLGHDILTGGRNADLFGYDAWAELGDTITDFRLRSDKLDVDALAPTAFQVNAVAGGAELVLFGAGGSGVLHFDGLSAGALQGAASSGMLFA